MLVAFVAHDGDTHLKVRRKDLDFAVDAFDCVDDGEEIGKSLISDLETADWTMQGAVFVEEKGS